MATVPSVTAIVFALAALIRTLLTDRTVKVTLDEENNRLREDMTGMGRRLSRLEIQYSEERHLKHQAINDLTAVKVLMGIVLALADRCTCGALASVDDMLTKYRENNP